MGNDRDEEPFETEVPRARMNPQSPTSPEKQEHEASGHAVYRNWCTAFVEGRGVGGQFRIELMEEEERERTTPVVAFDCGFHHTRKCRRFQFRFFRDRTYFQTGAT